MKNLYLIRHAKSSWDDAKVTDLDRPLNEKGHQDAKLMAEFLYSQSIAPDLLVSSPANRAISTCQYFASVFDYNIANIQQNTAIYEAIPNDLYRIIQQLDNIHNTVLFFGHNPSISYFLDEYINDYIPEVAACGIVHFEMHDQNWKNFSPEKAKFVALWEPNTISKNLFA